MTEKTAVVRPERAGGGANMNYVQPSCTCGWVGALYSTQTIEGHKLAERDATRHHDRHLAARSASTHLAYNPATERHETGGDEIEFADEGDDY